MRAKLLRSCPTLCDRMDCSPPGSLVYGILQARILEWIAMPSSKGSSQARVESAVLTSPALAGGFFTTSAQKGSPKKVGEAVLLQPPAELAVPAAPGVMPSSPSSQHWGLGSAWTGSLSLSGSAGKSFLSSWGTGPWSGIPV